MIYFYDIHVISDFFCSLVLILLGGDYMISVSRDEILSRFAGIPAVL